VSLVACSSNIGRTRDGKIGEDRLATTVVDLLVLVPTGAHGKANGSTLSNNSFLLRLLFANYTELTRRDRLVRRDVVVVMIGLLQSLELEKNECLVKYSTRRTAWSPCSLLDMIRTLRETSLQVCRREDFRRLHDI